MSLFAKRSVIIVGMISVSSIAPFRKKRLQAYRGRGDIYSWLRTHSHSVAERLAAGHASWAFIAAEMGRHGVAGRDGEAPSANAILRVWQRVCRDMATMSETPGQPQQRPKPPSRFPKGWTPPIVSSSEIPVPAYLRPPGTAVPAPFKPPPLPVRPQGPAGQEVAPTSRPRRGSMEAAMEKLSEGDWWMGGVRRKPRSDES